MRSLLLAASITAALTGCAVTQPDKLHTGHAIASTWQPTVDVPAFAPGGGPTVAVDSAHGNWHTLDGRFDPFGRLLASDGYRVIANDKKISAESLAKIEILVIANAVKGGETSEWLLPTSPAFADAEVEAIKQWVELGGSLLLIADHMPFPGSVEKLAAAFGVEFINGYAKPAFDGDARFVFTRSSDLLLDHPLTRGRVPGEKIDHVKTFTGQAFRLSGQAEPVLRVPDDWSVYLPQDGIAPLRMDTPRLSAKGLVQGAVVTHGRGRVALFGEAAMFTAQEQLRGDQSVKTGMNDPEADQNAQFVLNIMHWLAGLL